MSDKSRLESQKRTLGVLAGITAVAILAATLWPFNFFPPNRVRWSPATGIVFSGAGVVVGAAPLKVEPDSSQSCSLELLLRPDAGPRSGTILGFYIPENPQHLLVRQSAKTLLVSHDILEAPGKLKRTKFVVDDIFRANSTLLVTITSGRKGTTIYANGSLVELFPRFRIWRSDFSGQMVLGTSPAQYEPWNGQIYGLAIYSKELAPAEVLWHYRNWVNGFLGHSELDQAIAYYNFTVVSEGKLQDAIIAGPDLQIPAIFSVPHKPLLESALKEFGINRTYIRSVVLNIAGFIPLGFVLCAYLALTRTAGRAILYTSISAGFLSFLIEVLQAYIPQRFSGMTDIATNTAGATLGAILMQRWRARTYCDAEK